MKPNENLNIATALAAATCTLLGSGVPAVVSAQEAGDWEFNTSLLYYGEDNDRVNDFSASAIAKRMFADDRILSLGLTIDGLTGATPSGAIQQGVAQTFTRPSGNDTYTVPAGNLPLDDTFKDTRVALSASWQQPWGDRNLVSVGGSFSKEYDYTHIGVNGRIARDFNQRNTTVSAGLALSMDNFDPVGGAPMPLTPMLDVGDISNRSGDQDKDVLDLVLGVTQVLSRDLVVQLNYSYSQSDGYLTDPYKVLSLVTGSSGDTLPRPPSGPGIEGPSHQFLFESRPDERGKHSVYAQAKYYLNGTVLDASYRYMTDDWDIDSHTVDFRYRIPFADSRYLEPHLRFYTQSEAEFYRLSLADAEPLPPYASADYRLGDFDAVTAGVKYGWKTRKDHDMSVRVEFYQQSGSIPSGKIIGNQADRNNYPDLNALIVQFSYRF